MSYIDLYMNRARTMLSSSGSRYGTVVYTLGVPFDSTTSYRPGTRFGPDAIRDALANIELNSILCDADVTLEDVNMIDLGNLKGTTNPDAMLDMLGKVMGEVAGRGLVTVLGGEHLLTLATYRGMVRGKGSSRDGSSGDDGSSSSNSSGISNSSSSKGSDGGTMLVVFDAHFDLRDEFHDCRLNHATYLRRIVEDLGGDASNILHIGARGYSREELDYARRSRMNTILARDIMLASIDSARGTIDSEVKRSISDVVSSYDDLYISIDLDAIDPAFAPGVGTPEPFGLHPLHVLGILELLVESGRRLICLDVVELCPPYDNGITSVLAAKLMLETIIMHVKSQQ
ncbi:MAG: agmatinase family protein [Candidatus Nitrosocaldus sp.]|nr:agmatinase family protein [Candidatus Nitrosocaldus sp.]